jgi:hypothetical protein
VAWVTIATMFRHRSRGRLLKTTCTSPIWGKRPLTAAMFIHRQPRARRIRTRCPQCVSRPGTDVAALPLLAVAVQLAVAAATENQEKPRFAQAAVTAGPR